MVEKKAKKRIKITEAGGKKYRAVKKLVDKTKSYDITEAVNFIKANIVAKFDETVEISLNLGIDAKQTDQLVRGVVSMPNGTGKTVRVAVFAREEKAKEARDAGADIVGSEDLIEKINQGEINFDVCVATPDMMGLVGRVARVLGPKGLMPNPKLGTVTANLESAIHSIKAGQVEFRSDKQGIVHAGVAKTSFDLAKIVENIKAFVGAISKEKPASSKGTFLKSAYISSTMSPSLKLDVTTLL